MRGCRIVKWALSAIAFAVSGSLFAQSLDMLDGLVQKALVSYPSILAREAGRQAAQVDLTAAKLKFLPNPSLSTQRNNVRFDGASSTGQMPATNIMISQPLFLDGGIVAGFNKASARLSAADYALLETREEISFRIISAYAEWVRAWLKIQALTESVKMHEKLVGLISRRFEQGVAAGADKDLAFSRLAQAIADLETQRLQEETALSSITELVGEPIERKNLSARLARELNLPKRTEGIARAKINSVTVQRAQFEAEAADQEAKEIRAQALPQLSVQAQRQIGNAYYPGAQGFNAVGLVINYNPGGGLSNMATASAASERARAAMFQVEGAKRELSDRLNAEYNDYEFSLLKKESLLRSSNLAADISNSYDRQYLVGRKSWLDLMNSVRERAQARIQLADAEASLLGASRRLIVYIDGTLQFDVAEQSK